MVCAVSAPVYKVDTTPLYALLAGHHIPTLFLFWITLFTLGERKREWLWKSPQVNVFGVLFLREGDLDSQTILTA